jgi:hypothetical protein
MPPIPAEWWLRPVRSACRVGEHRAVVWKRLYFWPPAAEPFRVRRLAGAAKGAGGAKTGIVNQDNEDISALPWADAIVGSAGT